MCIFVYAIHINNKRRKKHSKKYCQAAIVIQSKSNIHTHRQTHDHIRKQKYFVSLVSFGALLYWTGFCMAVRVVFSLHFISFHALHVTVCMSYMFLCVILCYLLFYFRFGFFSLSLLFHNNDCGFNMYKCICMCNSYRLIANAMVVSDVLSQH